MNNLGMNLGFGNVGGTSFPVARAPERHLLVAVLKRAILDFLGNNQRVAEDAETWMFEPETEDEFTFPWVCKHLNVDTGDLLSRLQELKEMPEKDEDLRRIASAN